MAIECGTAAHDDAKNLAWVAIIIYPCGMLALNASLLFAARHAILKKRPTKLSSAISFLYREYETHFFWWELVEMLRRFVLVGLMVLAQGSMLQLIMGTLLSAVFLLFQVQAAPYESMSDDFLSSGANFALVAIFLCSYAFKEAALTGLADVQSKMSDEQRDVYVISTLSLTIIVTASVLGALSLSFILFVMQLTVEGRRLRKEARASKARRLRLLATGEEAHAPVLPSEMIYHTFLSHVWGTGQDQMRIIKQRLGEMVPDLVVFLDVDDLEVIDDLEGYIERARTILIYCSSGYFKSKNCMRELVSATSKQKPLIALIDPDASRGGLSLEQVHAQLLEADDLYLKWGFNCQHESIQVVRAQALFEHLFAFEQVEWNRIGHFQDVTMRLIAERLIPDASGTTYVDNEIVNQKLKPLPQPKQSFHIYCAALNPGSRSLVIEVSRVREFQIHFEAEADGKSANKLYVTTEPANLARSDTMLVYLTGQTWTRGDESAKLGEEIGRAMDLDVNVLLVHEMPGAGGQEARHGCEFSSFFSCSDGATPPELLRRGIYSSIAVPLKGGPWREASMALLGMALGMSKDQLDDTNKKGTGSLAVEGLLDEIGELSMGATRQARSLTTSAVQVSKIGFSLPRGLSWSGFKQTATRAPSYSATMAHGTIASVAVTSAAADDTECVDRLEEHTYPR